MARLRHDDAGERHADLSAERALRRSNGLRRGFDVVIVVDDGGRLSTEFEGVTRNALPGERRDTSADHARTGERDLVDPRVANQLLRDLAVCGHHVQNTGRQTDLLGDLGQNIELARSFRRRLEHDGAAREQRRSDFVNRERQRRVPGNDGSDDADRLFDDDTERCALGRGYGLERIGRRQICMPVERVRHALDGVARDRIDHAGLARPERRGLVCAGTKASTQFAQVLPAHLGLEKRPRRVVEGVARGCDRGIHVFGARLTHAIERLFGRRVDDVEPAAAGWHPPFAVDIEAVGVLESNGGAAQFEYVSHEYLLLQFRVVVAVRRAGGSARSAATSACARAHAPTAVARSCRSRPRGEHQRHSSPGLTR